MIGEFSQQPARPQIIELGEYRLEELYARAGQLHPESKRALTVREVMEQAELAAGAQAVVMTDRGLSDDALAHNADLYERRKTDPYNWADSRIYRVFSLRPPLSAVVELHMTADPDQDAAA